MRRIIITSLLLGCMMMVFVASPVYAKATQYPLGPGWDLPSEPLDMGKVIVNAPDSTGKLQLTVIVHGASPSQVYTAILAFWYPVGGPYVIPLPGDQSSSFIGSDYTTYHSPFVLSSFGQFPNTYCGNAGRRGFQAAADSFILGTFITDATGAGSFHVNIKPVPAGSYAFQVNIDKGDVLGGTNQGNAFITGTHVGDNNIAVTIRRR